MREKTKRKKDSSNNLQGYDKRDQENAGCIAEMRFRDMDGIFYALFGLSECDPGSGVGIYERDRVIRQEKNTHGMKRKTLQQQQKKQCAEAVSGKPGAMQKTTVADNTVPNISHRNFPKVSAKGSSEKQKYLLRKACRMNA